MAGSATVGTFDRTGGSATLKLSGPVGGRYRQEPHWRPAPKELGRFAGDYYSAEVGSQYSIWLERGRLLLRERRLGTLPLTPTCPGEFFTSGFYLSFTDGPDGPVDSAVVGRRAGGTLFFVGVFCFEGGQPFDLPLVQWLGAGDHTLEIRVAATDPGRRRFFAFLRVLAANIFHLALFLPSALSLPFLLGWSSTCCQIHTSLSEMGPGLTRQAGLSRTTRCGVAVGRPVGS